MEHFNHAKSRFDTSYENALLSSINKNTHDPPECSLFKPEPNLAEKFANYRSTPDLSTEYRILETTSTQCSTSGTYFWNLHCNSITALDSPHIAVILERWSALLHRQLCAESWPISYADQTYGAHTKTAMGTQYPPAQSNFLMHYVF